MAASCFPIRTCCGAPRLFVSAARAVAVAGAHRRRSAGRPAALRSGRRAWRFPAPVWTTAQAPRHRALQRLEEEIARQILPDGGHITRSPEALVHAYRHLVMVMDALTALDHEVPQPIRSAHDRIAPMLRFFRHGDGALALFNGGGESDPQDDRGAARARRSARPAFRSCAPFGLSAHGGEPHACGHGLRHAAQGRVLPMPRMRDACHSNSAAGSQRIVVNCGAAAREHDGTARCARPRRIPPSRWPTRRWPAILSEGFARDLIGARLLGGPSARRNAAPRDRRMAGASRQAMTAISTNSASSMSGASTLSPDGAIADRRRHARAQGAAVRERVPFAVRFHIHPDVRVSPSQGGGVLLKLPSGEGWRFRCGGARSPSRKASIWAARRCGAPTSSC